MPFLYGQGALSGDRGIMVSVGGSKPFRVLFDTGSTGLRVGAPMVGSNVRRTGIKRVYSYGSGTVFEGELAYAPVSVGPIPTTTSVPIMIVENEHCLASKPHCPGNVGLSGQMARRRYGTMGVGFNTGNGIPSPLVYLPSPLNAGFVVAGDTLTIGLPASLKQTFKTVPLVQTSPGLANGDPAWDDKVNVTWRVNGQTISGSPIRTLFDTGGIGVGIGVPSGTIPSSWLTTANRFRYGIPVEATIPGIFDLRVRSGARVGVNLFHVNPTPRTDPFVNIGWLGFHYLDVMFDQQDGELGFRRPR